MLYQSHPWFKNIVWDKLYEMEAAFKPEVNGELDTQNFMKFDEVLYNIILIFSYFMVSLYLHQQYCFFFYSSTNITAITVPLIYTFLAPVCFHLCDI